MCAPAEELPVAVLVVGDVKDGIASGDVPADECRGVRRVLEFEAFHGCPPSEESATQTPPRAGELR
jgi:hypothetical protein